MKRAKASTLVHITDDVPMEDAMSSTSQDSDDSIPNSQIVVLLNQNEQDGRKKLREKLQKSTSNTSESEIEERQKEVNRKKIMSSQQTPKASKIVPRATTPVQEQKHVVEPSPKPQASLPPLPPKPQVNMVQSHSYI